MTAPAVYEGQPTTTGLREIDGGAAHAATNRLRTLGDVRLSDLASAEARRARSLVLGAACALEGDALEEFVVRMEVSWRRQVLAVDRELAEQEQALDESRRGMLRRADAIVADVLEQLLERAEP